MARPNPVRPRGPLPASVYWRRRVLVLGIALLLVVGIGRLLSGSSDGDSDQGAVRQSSADQKPSESASSTEGATPAETESTPFAEPTRTKTTKEPLPEPEGECEDADIVATTDLDQVVGGSRVKLPITLETKESPACTWELGPETLTLTITSGKDEIWTSRECTKAIDTREVVVRSATETSVEIKWSTRRSDAECSRSTNWALPGWYHLEVAALGGEPYTDSFELVPPEDETITAEPTPDESDDDKQDKSDKPKKKDDKQRDDADAEPSGAVEPNG